MVNSLLQIRNIRRILQLFLVTVIVKSLLAQAHFNLPPVVLERILFLKSVHNLNGFPLVEKAPEDLLRAVPLSHVLESVLDFFETLVI